MRFVTICLYMSFLVSQQTCDARRIITNPDRSDGFGAQFQTIIYSVIFAELNGIDFVYTPFNAIEHNYDNDSDFIAKKEQLINFMDNFEINTQNAARLGAWEVIQFFERNLAACSKSDSLKKIKKLFRANKNRSTYFDREHLHIVVHIRRYNPHDNRIDGTNTPDELFLAIINALRIIYANQNPLFHLHSQGKIESFNTFQAPDIILHLNETVEDSFTQMVLADILVTSRSSYSYTAAILSEGIIYYMPFWHPPLPHWKLTNQLV